MKKLVSLLSVLIVLSPAAMAAGVEAQSSINAQSALISDDNGTQERETHERIAAKASKKVEDHALEAHETLKAHGEKHGKYADDAHKGHGKHGDHHKTEGLPQFDPSSFASQAFWLVIIFSGLYLFFSKKTLPDISNVLSNRQEHIQSDLEMAEQLRAEAEEVHQSYEEALSEAHEQASTYFTQAEEKIKETSTQKMQEFQENALQKIQDTEKNIQVAKENALEELNGIAAEIASQASEKIVGISPDINNAKNVVESLHKNKKAA